MENGRRLESFVIQFELLKSFKVIHGSFTREIDASQGVEKIKQALDVPYLIQSEQVHGNQVFHVENLEVGIPPCDALITSLKGVGLLIRHADCQAALFMTLSIGSLAQPMLDGGGLA